MKKYKEEDIKKIFQEAKLPKNTKFLGYVINLSESDEYLLKTDSESLFVWTKSPQNAKLFKRHGEASKFIKMYSQNNVTLCLIFDIESQWVTLPEKDAQEIINLI